MRKVTLFIAMSLDGYIADCRGKVEWLEGQSEDIENVDSLVRIYKRNRYCDHGVEYRSPDCDRTFT